MKTKKSTRLAAVVVAMPIAAYAIITDPTGFASGGNNAIPTNANAIAVGTWNYADQGSIAVGYGSEAEGNSLAVGHDTYAGSSSLVCGQDAFVESSSASAAFGSITWINQSDSSFAAGEFNSLNQSDRSIAMGKNNSVYSSAGSCSIGNGNVISNNPDSITIGRNVNGQTGVVALGTYNAASPSSNVLIVGCGTSSERKNALEVRSDGQIVINQPQGDISMGIYE